jgi:hypothetical protein
LAERIYLDADSCNERLAAALGRAGFTVAELGELAEQAVDVLRVADRRRHLHLRLDVHHERERRAVELGAVLVTGNSVDFARIHRDWSAQGLGHSGVVTIRRIPPRSPEALAEVLVALMREHTPDSFANSFHRV